MGIGNFFKKHIPEPNDNDGSVQNNSISAGEFLARQILRDLEIMTESFFIASRTDDLKVFSSSYDLACEKAHKLLEIKRKDIPNIQIEQLHETCVNALETSNELRADALDRYKTLSVSKAESYKTPSEKLNAYINIRDTLSDLRVYFCELPEYMEMFCKVSQRIWELDFDVKNDVFDAACETEESGLLKSIVSSSSKTFKITEFENAFFVAFEKHIKDNRLSDLEYSIERKSNGCIRICTLNGRQMCDIHLRKRIGSILYFTGDGIEEKDIHHMRDAPFESVIAVIPYVIKYIKQSREEDKEFFVS